MTLIEAINNVAKAYQDLVIVFLAVADKNGGVPVGQAMTVDSKEAPANKESVKTETKEAKLAEKSITIEQVRSVLAEKSQEGLTDKVKALLESFGANKLSDVKEENYPALLEKAKEL